MIGCEIPSLKPKCSLRSLEIRPLRMRGSPLPCRTGLKKLDAVLLRRLYLVLDQLF